MLPAPHRGDYGRLVKTLRLLDAPNPGERLAALDAANRQLKTLGLTWCDIADELPTGGDDEPTHLALAVELMRAGRGVLTAWEIQFLIGSEAFDALSPRQQQQLAAIRRRVVRSAGVAAFVGS